jgi:uncharacterized protein (TIGR02246 family)
MTMTTRQARTRRAFISWSLALTATLAGAPPASAQASATVDPVRPRPVPAAARDDSAAVAAVVARFHDALAAGDSAAALALLADDAVVVESGAVETREQYRRHHLPADIGFARAVRSERAPVRVTVRGEAAWTVATSATRGTYRGRPVNADGAEVMVLARTADGWRIAAIHWSSRRRSS